MPDFGVNDLRRREEPRMDRQLPRFARPYVIDDESDLDPAWLEGVMTVGLTAGASAPERLVQRVIDELAGLGPVEVFCRTIAQESISLVCRRS